jgi:DNA-binding XRE family transcriptional regulator
MYVMQPLPAPHDLNENPAARQDSPRRRMLALAPAVPALQPYTAIIDGPRLRQFRRERGLSVEILAHDAGIAMTTLKRLERQPRPRCRLCTQILLARALNADPAAIAVLVRLTKNDLPFAPDPRPPGPRPTENQADRLARPMTGGPPWAAGQAELSASQDRMRW